MAGDEILQILQRIEGEWCGAGVLFPTPWTPAGEVNATLSVSLLAPATAVLRYRHKSGPAFESWTAAATDGRAWTFDSFGFVPEQPGRVTADGEGLVLERSSPRGLNRTQYQVTQNALEMTVHFIPATPGAESMAVARSVLTRE